MSNVSQLSILGTFRIFQDLTPDEIRSIEGVFQNKTYSSGEFLMREGEPSHSLQLIVDGFAHVTRLNDANEPMFLCTLSAGAVIGEAALFAQLQRTATIRADGEVRVLDVNRDTFKQFLEAHPQAARKILLQMLFDVFQKLQTTTFELRTQRSAGMKQSSIDQLFS